MVTSPPARLGLWRRIWPRQVPQPMLLGVLNRGVRAGSRPQIPGDFAPAAF